MPNNEKALHRKSQAEQKLNLFLASNVDLSDILVLRIFSFLPLLSLLRCPLSLNGLCLCVSLCDDEKKIKTKKKLEFNVLNSSKKLFVLFCTFHLPFPMCSLYLSSVFNPKRKKNKMKFKKMNTVIVYFDLTPNPRGKTST